MIINPADQCGTKEGVTMKIFWQISTRETHLVIEDEQQQKWLVPISPQGWLRKTKFKGRENVLEPFTPEGATGMMLACLACVGYKKAIDRSIFSSRLIEAIDRAGLSGTALAETSGLTRQSIHLLLQGDREPTLDTASKLATALNVSIDWLAGNQ